MKSKEQAGRYRLFSIAALSFFLLLCTAFRLSAQTPANYPTWWANYGVLSGTTPNDYAVANQGQAKNIAVAAISELDNDLAQFGGSQLDSLSAILSGTTAQTNDYAAINLGQLKALAQPFYDRLLSLGYTLGPLSSGTYPWIGHTPNDYAAANIGQLKYAFSFDVTSSSTGSTIPDWWIMHYFGSLTVSGTTLNPSAFVPWSAGQVTYLQAYQQGLNPIDFYNGQTPTLAIVSGNGQTGPPGGYVPNPLVVSVANASGTGIAGAPVTFQVTSGSGYVQVAGAVAASGSATVFANGSGQAEVYFLLSGNTNATTQITATTGTGSSMQQVQFTASTDNGSGQFASPFAPSNCIGTVNGDGSLTITWTNNTNGIENYILVEQQQSGGTWQAVSPQLPAGTTSYQIVSPSGSGRYRVDPYTPDALNPGGDPPNPGPPVFFPISGLPFAAIDLSGTTTNGNPVNLVTIDDSNNIAYGFFAGTLGTYSDAANTQGFSNQFTTYTWSNGQASPVQTVPTGATEVAESGTESYTIGLAVGGVPLQDFGIDAAGDLWGVCGLFNESGAGQTLGFVTGKSTASGTATVFGNTLNPAYPPYGSATLPGAGTVTPALYINELTSPTNYSGYARGYLPNDINQPLDDGVLVHSGTTIIFDSTLTQADVGNCTLVSDSFFPSGNLVPPLPHQLNAAGWVLGLSEDYYSLAVWTGTSVVPLPGTPVALNNEGYVAGYQTDPSTDLTTAYIWTSGSGVQPLAQLLPTAYQSEVTNIQPIDISGTDTDGSINVLFLATYQTDSGGDQASGTFLLTLTGGTNANVLQQVSFPASVKSYYITGPITLSPQRIMVAVANISMTGTEGASVTGTDHAVVLVPEDLIQVDAFIPQTWVYEPPLAIFADSGNSRKNPLDASLTSGSAIFIQNSPEFKVRQTLNVCSYSYYDPDGSLEEATKQTKVGGTREYRAGQLVNGEIPANAVPNASGTATPSIDDVTVDHLSQGVVAATFEMQVSNPIAIGASLAPIEYNITVKIDRSNPSQPVYTVFGSNCEFPAYEIYINGQQVYHYDPIPAGDGPADLLWGMTQSFNNTGPLDH